MEALFTPQYALVWGVVLGLMLFLPVRQLIWSLYVRRASKDTEIDEAEALRLKKRATVTSALLCFVFAMFYVNYLFQ